MLENCTFLRKGLEVCKNRRTFARVFFIVLDLRLTKVWVTAVTLFLYSLLSFALAKQVSVAFNQLSHQQESIDSHKAIAY